MKNIFAIVVIISSLILLLNKRLAIFTSWVKTEANIIGLNNINKTRVDYEYNVDGEKYDGYLIVKSDEVESVLNNSLSIYYHRVNPELSIKNIPVNMEDYLLGLISIFGGLYLYLFSCESCEVPKLNSINTIPIVKPSRFV
jgi:hypothetical protein